MTRTVVVDGSNLATEGRPLPSLRQLQEAVDAFRAEHPTDQLIIVADATFGHRIDPSEVAEFDLWVDHGQIVCPPAGAVGRGDAFVLSIANKSGATVLSNDSFQEFHGTYPWLFDEGRLIGGKPVPHVGWVFVARTPVRGPISRKAVQTAKRAKRDRAGDAKAPKASPEAFKPMPVPKAPPPGRAKKVEPAHAAPASPPPVAPVHTPAPPTKNAPINELLPFLEFVERHPVGTPVEATFDTYSSHGAYANAGNVRVYVPLRNMADPAPRSAREAVKIGETRTVVVAAFNAGRRGVDAAFPEMAASLGVATTAPASASDSAAPAKRAKKAGRRGASPAEAPVDTVASGPEVAAPAPAAEAAPAAREGRGGRGRRGRSAAPATPDAAAAPAPTPAPEAPAAPAPVQADESRPRRNRGTGTSATLAKPAAEAPAVPAAAEPATPAAKRRRQAAPAAVPASSTNGEVPAATPAPAKKAAKATKATKAAAPKATKAAAPTKKASPAKKAAKAPAAPAADGPAPAKKATRKKAAAQPAS